MSSQPGEFRTEAVAAVFSALGDPTRLNLLMRLCDGLDHSIVELAAGTALTRQGVTKHLAVLERASLVSSRRAGRESRYAMRPEALAAAQAYLRRASRQWDDAILRLKDLLET